MVAGVLSGTSADGIDVALVRFETGSGRPRALAFETLPFENALAERLRAVLDGHAQPGLGELARLDRDLGRAFGRAARALALDTAVDLHLVASHGQTVWHHDGAGVPATLQLGDGCHVAGAAGVPAATDFRQADIAAGGEGAPLSALADECVFAGTERPLLVLNLGGISNVTRLPEPGGELVAFDTGPAGSLLDGFARQLLGRPLDRDGAVAARGRVREDLLASWLPRAFLESSPPRSTGRDTFGRAWIDGLLAETDGVPVADLLRTAVELVAACVADGMRRFLPPTPGAPLVLCGGGVHHPGLVRALSERGEVVSSAELGVDPDAREALVFAVLGARCALGIPSTAPAATGADPGRVLGKLSLGRGSAPEE